MTLRSVRPRLLSRANETRSDPRRVLIIARGHVGDLVATLPLFRDLRRAYPRATITAVVNEYARGLLERCPYVDEVIYGFTYRRRRAPGRALHLLRVALRVIGRYDTCLVLRRHPQSAALLAWLSGARTRIGFTPKGFARRFLTHDLGRRPTRLSNRIANLIPAAALGVAVDPSYDRIDWLPVAASRRATELLRAYGVTGEPGYAVLQVSSNWGCNEWSSEKWAAVGDFLVKAHALRVVLVGSADPHEREKCGEVEARMLCEAIRLDSRTTLPELIVIIGRAAIALGTDSAVTQIALVQRTPAVVLFGTEPIQENGPLREEAGRLMEPIQHWDEQAATADQVFCRFGQSYCHFSMCRENTSLRQTTVAEVCERIDRLLARTRVRTGKGAGLPTVSSG